MEALRGRQEFRRRPYRAYDCGRWDPVTCRLGGAPSPDRTVNRWPTACTDRFTQAARTRRRQGQTPFRCAKTYQTMPPPIARISSRNSRNAAQPPQLIRPLCPSPWYGSAGRRPSWGWWEGHDSSRLTLCEVALVQAGAKRPNVDRVLASTDALLSISAPSRYVEFLCESRSFTRPDPLVHHLAQQPRLRRTAPPHHRPGYVA